MKKCNISFHQFFNTLKGFSQMLLPVFSKRLPGEEKLFNERISGLNLNIWTVSIYTCIDYTPYPVGVNT